MKFATWNVNSLKIRLPHVLKWLGENPVDVLCLQELKIIDEKFPLADIQAAGYHVVFCGQKTYNGVAILSRYPITNVVKNNPLFPDDHQRIISATTAGVRVVCVYIPNGQSLDSDKFAYKMQWLKALHNWLKDECARHPKLALMGDYNIAPEDRDVCDPAAWEGQTHVSEPERNAFRDLLALNMKDAFSMFEQPEKLYSWWDYRQMAFRRNMGLRIDHILLTKPLAKRCVECVIDKVPRKWKKPSDHAPVVATLK